MTKSELAQLRLDVALKALREVKRLVETTRWGGTSGNVFVTVRDAITAIERERPQ